jgi:hypothetical protein
MKAILPVALSALCVFPVSQAMEHLLVVADAHLFTPAATQLRAQLSSPGNYAALN